MSWTIKLHEYDPQWGKQFEGVKQELETQLADYVSAVHHIGSTAVPGLCAKPILDVLLELKDFTRVSHLGTQLQCLGFQPLKPHIIPYHSFFSRRLGDIDCHLHIFEHSDPQVERHLHFRDYLIAHPEIRDAYGVLKTQLATQHPADRVAYNAGKTNFVCEIDYKAKFDFPARPYHPKRLPAYVADDVLVKAMESNFYFYLTHFAQYLPEVTFQRQPRFTLVSSGAPEEEFNCVVSNHLQALDPDQDIMDAIHFFKEAGLSFSWWISPNDYPKDLDFALEKRGLLHTESFTGMWLNLDEWQSTAHESTLKVERVLNAEQFNAFTSVFTSACSGSSHYFDAVAQLPLNEGDPICLYVGYIDEQPVATAMMVGYAGVAGLYFLHTHPDHRRHTYTDQMQKFCFQKSKELGYHILTLHASSVGVHTYTQQGFKSCCEFKEYKAAR